VTAGEHMNHKQCQSVIPSKITQFLHPFLSTVFSHLY